MMQDKEGNFGQELTDFFQRERSRLVAYVRKSFTDHKAHEAEDLIQDVFLRLWEADLDPIDNLAGYVFQALRNRLTDLFRRKNWDEASLDRPLNPDGSESASWLEILADLRQDQAGKLEAQEREEALFRAVDQLSDAQKSVFIATEIEGWTFEELSELWDEPLGTLLSRKHRALQSLRKKIQKLR
ncbi:MAG: sigma-70 family RNA polymerase sigma factor [Spirochaetales bacterium]|nr:sigma-70 family RNA polymerase sigma factor [Spirochaetales bacterium]